EPEDEFIGTGVAETLTYFHLHVRRIRPQTLQDMLLFPQAFFDLREPLPGREFDLAKLVVFTPRLPKKHRRPRAHAQEKQQVKRNDDLTDRHGENGFSTQSPRAPKR